MNCEELENKDSSFNSSEFISRSNLMIKKVFNAITLGKLVEVDHFIGDNVYKKLEDEINNSKNREQRVIYDQVNVNSTITDISENNDYYIIIVDALCKYYKYYVDSDSNFIRGDKDSRSEKHYKVTFKKNKSASLNITSRCLGCGVSFNINDSGVCPNCGRVYDLEEFSYVIDSFL